MTIFILNSSRVMIKEKNSEPIDPVIEATGTLGREVNRLCNNQRAHVKREKGDIKC
jgi:hypothetical protein